MKYLAHIPLIWFTFDILGPLLLGLILLPFIGPKYLWNKLKSIDQGMNTTCGGDPDEYISSRIGKRRDGAERFWARVVDWLFFWQKNHTQNAIEEDEGKDGVA